MELLCFLDLESCHQKQDFMFLCQKSEGEHEAPTYVTRCRCLQPVRAPPAAATVSVASSKERRDSFHASEKVFVHSRDSSRKSMRLLCGWRIHHGGASVEHFDANVSTADTLSGSKMRFPGGW